MTQKPEIIIIIINPNRTEQRLNLPHCSPGIQGTNNLQVPVKVRYWLANAMSVLKACHGGAKIRRRWTQALECLCASAVVGSNSCFRKVIPDPNGWMKEASIYVRSKYRKSIGIDVFWSCVASSLIQWLQQSSAVYMTIMWYSVLLASYSCSNLPPMM